MFLELLIYRICVFFGRDADGISGKSRLTVFFPPRTSSPNGVISRHGYSRFSFLPMHPEFSSDFINIRMLFCLSFFSAPKQFFRLRAHLTISALLEPARSWLIFPRPKRPLNSFDADSIILIISTSFAFGMRDDLWSDAMQISQFSHFQPSVSSPK